MVLVTSSTISVALSSGIVFLFTFLLFLSGYVLQQQTVRSIQEAIRAPSPPQPQPKLPKWAEDLHYAESAPAAEVQVESTDSISTAQDQDEAFIRVEKQFGHPPGTPGYQQPLSPKNTQDTRVKSEGAAYLQILSRPYPSDICSVILFFKTLALDGNRMPDRIVAYPESWDVNPLSDDLAVALATLRQASTDYGIQILAITPNNDDNTTPEATMLASASITLRRYEQVLYFKSPGLILDIDGISTALLSAQASSLYKEATDAFKNNWISVPLSSKATELSPALLISSHVFPTGRSTTTYHIPTSGDEDVNPLAVSFATAADFATAPAYIYFDDMRGQAKGWLNRWLHDRQAVCPRLKLG